MVRIRIRSESMIFGLSDPVLFSPDPDPKCNNGYILCIHIFFLMLCLYKEMNIFFSFRMKVGSGFCSAEPDPDPRENIIGSSPLEITLNRA